MIRRACLPLLIAAGLALTGCPARPPASLVATASQFPIEAAGAGQLVLHFTVPQPADRHVAYVPVASTQSVRVTVSGPKYRDDTKTGTPKPLMQTIGSFGVVPTGGAATVTVNNIRPGNNLTVMVEVFDGPLSGTAPTGTPTGKLLETLYGLVNIVDAGTSTASVGWATTPAGRAMALLRQQDDPARVVATDGAALQALVQTLIDTPNPGANHPVLISGDELGQALLRYTRQQANWPVNQGYAIPPATDPVLTGVVAVAAQAPVTRVYDLHGTELTANVQLTLGDPISAVDAASPFAFPRVAPGDWWIFAAGTNGDTRKGAFYKHFAEGDPDALRSAFLSGVTSNFAGTGVAGAGTATKPQFSDPHQICYDAAGTLFVADTGNHRIVKLDAAGKMTVVAGTGTAGATGDGAAATLATLRSPEGVAVDTLGNVYIADTGNHKIRIVDATTGNISTVAGTGTAGFNDDGTASTRLLSGPTNMVIGGSSPPALIFHDSGNKLIRKIPLGGSITTTSVTSLAIPDLTSQHTGLAYQTVGGVEYLYYCTLSPARVIRQAITGLNAGQKVIVAGGGSNLAPFDDGVPGAQAQLSEIRAIAVDPLGNVYIGDRWPSGLGHGRVRFVAPDKFTEIFTVLGVSGANAYGAGGTLGQDTAIGAPYGLAVPPAPAQTITVATGGDQRVVTLAP
jgi:hypothetical protein